MAYKKIIIPEVELEIGDNLFLKITDVSFIPAKAGYISGPPEECYPDEGAEAGWKDENCHLMKKLSKINKQGKHVKLELEFDCDPALSTEYLDQIIESIEQMEC